MNNEALANSLWNDLIKNVRWKFKGKIAVILNAEAFLSDTKNTEYEDYGEYDYYREANILQLNIHYLFWKYKTGNISLEGLAEAYGRMLSDIDAELEKGVEVSVLFQPFSYKNSSNLGIIEFCDILDQKTS